MLELAVDIWWTSLNLITNPLFLPSYRSTAAEGIQNFSHRISNFQLNRFLHLFTFLVFFTLSSSELCFFSNETLFLLMNRIKISDDFAVISVSTYFSISFHWNEKWHSKIFFKSSSKIHFCDSGCQLKKSSKTCAKV